MTEQNETRGAIKKPQRSQRKGLKFFSQPETVVPRGVCQYTDGILAGKVSPLKGCFHEVTIRPRIPHHRASR